MIDPICVVFESSNGARRGISPWTDPRSQDGVTAEAHFVGAESSASPLAAVLHELAFELSELMLNGLRRAGNIEASRWENLATQLARVGLVRLGDRVRTLAHQLAERSDHANWSPGEAAATLLNLLMLARLADDLPPD